MPAQDTTQIKEKIMRFLRIRGPSLPVHIAGEISQSILFTSAFLSELLSERKIKISNLRVGSSPVYFIPGQERGLEKYSQHLKSKEKEAFTLLKEKKFLKDIDQLPAIRVALRSINDFAIPFKPANSDEIFWRFFTVPESELRIQQPIPKKLPSLATPKKMSERSEPSPRAGGRELLQKPETLDIFDSKPQKETTAKKKSAKKKTAKKKVTSNNQDNKFFNKVKEFLAKKGIEISDIEGFSKSDLTLRVKIKGQEKLLVAYNKKRIAESDITKAHKKASDLNMQYIILSLGEPLKKLSNLIEAVKDLDSIGKIE